MSSLTSFCSSNLELFLHHVTPTVPSRPLPQSCFNDLNILWQPPGKDIIEYFTLRDLWDCYDEWSAYGAGTPVLMSGRETVMQYYVPYLSAIQIYTNKSGATSRNRKDDSDVAEFESDSWSDDSGSDNLSRSLSNHSSKAWDAVSEDSSLEQEGSLAMKDRLGCLYLHYIETASPYWRVPFSDKITELSQSSPALMTLKSVDLSPASWMAVAWYPIYHIPSQKNEKDLSACFLSYHTLSSTFQDDTLENVDTNIKHAKCHHEVMGNVGQKSKEESNGGISLPPFGLATYKLQGDLWIKPQTSDRERIIHLYSAADSWLKQLSIQHHDFNFFTFHATM
ncbi:uncharacterized protein LOC122299781 [Carya illinoinensis]|uniref:Uncharacterized protein n=1 Tax=Carya illinoinensis TaxID=32201 RepID=A0A8T1N5K7_CARIL|nr:uncharacterized protein LOC122299781 [Carya illinoinensis]KAG6625161.1 hypothetical protein CIPAW_16G077100 [Carya illinoinensis]